MVHVVQQVNLSDDAAQLCASSTFQRYDPVYGETHHVERWSSDPDGTQIFYDCGKTAHVISSMCLWAVYKDIIRKITYYPTVGYAWTNKIKDTFRLDDSGIPGFAGWTVNGKFYAKSSDDFSKPLTVDTDYVALMSCYSSYTLSYDSNSGTGTMPSYSSSCATYVNDTLEVKTTAEEVALGECEFQRTFIAPDDGTQYMLNFYKWNVNGIELSAGQAVQLSQDITAYAQWRYPVLYDVTTVCVPVAAAKLAAYGDGSTASERRMSNMKTLSAFDVRDGFYFDGWYDESGDRVSDKLCCVVEMAKKSDSYMFARSVAKYSARFTYDDDYTIVMTASDKSAMRKVTGTLKRADLLGMSPFMSRMHMMQQNTISDEPQFVTVRAF